MLEMIKKELSINGPVQSFRDSERITDPTLTAQESNLDLTSKNTLVPTPHNAVEFVLHKVTIQ